MRLRAISGTRLVRGRLPVARSEEAADGQRLLVVEGMPAGCGNSLRPEDKHNGLDGTFESDMLSLIVCAGFWFGDAIASRLIGYVARSTDEAKKHSQDFQVEAS